MFADEFTKLSQGKEIMYRGVHDSNDLTAKEMVEQFKRGKFYSGDGTYVDYDKSAAMYYAYEAGATSNGEVRKCSFQMMQK